MAASVCGAEKVFPAKVKRVLFLGDSIAHAGDYIVLVETQLRLQGLDPEVINLGLPSETRSILTDPERPFPRPDIHSPLDAALKKTRPDVVVACYGMNDGIIVHSRKNGFRPIRSVSNRS